MKGIELNDIYQISLAIFLSILVYIFLILWNNYIDFVVIGDSIYTEAIAQTLNLKHNILRIKTRNPVIRNFNMFDGETINHYSLLEPNFVSLDTLTEFDLDILSNYLNLDQNLLYNMSMNGPIEESVVQTLIVDELPEKIQKVNGLFLIGCYTTRRVIFGDAGQPKIGDIILSNDSDFCEITEKGILQYEEPETEVFSLQTPREIEKNGIITVHPFHFPSVSEPLTATFLISQLISEGYI